MTTTVIRGGTVVTPTQRFAADLYLRDGTIVAVGGDIDIPADTVIDATGCLLLPGGVDPHVHLDFPSLSTTTADDSHSGTAAAALGGTTTIVNFALQRPAEPLPAALERSLAQAEGRAVVDYGFHVVVRDLGGDRVRDIDEIVAAGASSIKLFMAYPGELMVDDATLLRAMERMSAAGGLTMVHAENGSAIDVLTQRALRAGHTSPQWHGKTRPTILEAEAVHRATVLAELVEAPTYFVHISCEEALAEVAAAKAEGLQIHAETCPHYLTLDSSVYDGDSFEIARYVMTPPLRDPHHQDRLWHGIRRGDVDVVSTDHCPFCMVGQKDAGADNFLKIPNGVGGVEYRLLLLFDRGVRQGRITVEQLVAITAANPAKLFGLFPRKGSLMVGSDADIVILDPDGETHLSIDTSPSKVDYSLYEGWTVAGAIEYVLSRGTPVVTKGVVGDHRGHGRYIPRGPTAPTP
ncbi:dihydropyrimidinase [Nocardia sp. alder85J]|uniref:dihydropyrimidinase n=1 Tax=Nocardia sp. alder85J TaxID=2862949 RepID=UPI001CD6645C|nr:dihydropyrimidinase [Nocardia sp. alder85J]MCX4097997.1 dihydropyrimidinase [Nocardia sp. alder85J]